ncbi:MAG: YqaJ viral recombinase family protein [Ilumatobacteraceae bacterium]|nr:YqaJ viral recombinase family protein [Ilumatobacteraceae bacterium]
MSDDPQWIAWRLGGITASDIARARSGRYGGRYGVVADKLGLTERAENEQMRRGLRWEQAIADAVHALTGLHVVGEQAWCQHPDYDHHRATVDGFLSPLPEATMADVSAGLEVKTHGTNVRPAWDYWLPQVQWQMWVTGTPRTLVAAAEIDDDTDELVALRLRWVTFDYLECDDLIVLADELWVHVQTGTLPEPDTATALDVVKTVHAEADADADTVDLSDMVDELRRLHEIKAAVKAVTEERDLLEARIRDRLAAATKGATPDGWRVSLSKPALVLTAEAEADLLASRPDLGRAVLDRDRARMEVPDLYAAHRQPVGARRLTLTAPKEHDS